MSAAGRGGALLRYARWQLRDYAIAKAGPTLLVGALTAYLNYAPVLVSEGRPPAVAGVSAGVASAFASTLVAVVLIGALFATNGIVADDRRLGYYRFLFAKPVSVRRFYAQKLVVHLAGFLLVVLVLLGANALVVAPHLPLVLLPAVVVLFATVAGIGFLASALWRFDWAALTAFLFAASLVWERWGSAPGWRGAVPLFFPPMTRFIELAAVATSGRALPVSSVVWLAGYGVVCFLLGVWVLGKRDLSS